MKVLLSAYACEPHKGSEAGVGWHWMLELARLGHDVWVLTRANNQEAIERAVPSASNLRFIYYDLPSWLVRLKKRGPFLQCYYTLWQWGAYRKARDLHQREKFDVVQHVTFGVFRHASLMGRLGVPFILGPIGGGESTPFRLRMDYGIKGHVLDAVRDLANAVAAYNPWLDETFETANLILVKTPATRLALPSRHRHKTRHLLEIGSAETIEGPPRVRQDDLFRFLFVGRFLFWKGMQYGLRAFARLLREVPNARLTMVGAGPEEQRWRRLSQTLGIAHAVEWIGWIPQAELRALYGRHDVFLFPSLHDSSGGVVLDAMSHGMPVVCFDLGGPGVLVKEDCGIVVPTAGRRCGELVVNLAEGMRVVVDQTDRFREWQSGALARARALTWAAAVRQVYANGAPEAASHLPSADALESSE